MYSLSQVKYFATENQFWNEIFIRVLRKISYEKMGIENSFFFLKKLGKRGLRKLLCLRISQDFEDLEKDCFFGLIGI